MAALNEELRFLNKLMRRFRRARRTRIFMRTKEVLGKIAAHKWVKEELSIEEVSSEMRDNAVRLRAVREELPVQQRSSSMQHGLIGRFPGPLVVPAIQFKLRLKGFALAVLQLELYV